MNIKKYLTVGAIAVAAILMLASAGFAAEDISLGFDDKEIRIAQLAPLSGPAAPWGVLARAGGAVFQMINDEGGIHGRKIKFFLRDDQYNPAQAKVVAKEVVEKHGIFAFVAGMGTAVQMAYKDYLIQKGIVWVNPASGGNEFKFPLTDTIFNMYPVYEDEASILTKYIVEDLKIKKIGMIYQNDPYGLDALKGVQKRLAVHKMKLVEAVPTEPTEKDFSSQVLKLKNSGAEAVIMWLVPNPAVITMKTAATLNYKPQWFTTSTLSDFPTMNRLTNGLWEGVVAACWVEPPDSNTPLVNRYREMHKKYTPRDIWGTNYLAGVAYVEPLVDALQRVGKNLSRKAFIDALNKTDFKGVGPRITWTPTQHQGVDSIYVAKCGPNGKMIKLKDWTRNDMASWK